MSHGYSLLHCSAWVTAEFPVNPFPLPQVCSQPSLSPGCSTPHNAPLTQPWSAYAVKSNAESMVGSRQAPFNHNYQMLCRTSAVVSSSNASGSPALLPSPPVFCKHLLPASPDMLRKWGAPLPQTSTSLDTISAVSRQILH